VTPRRTRWCRLAVCGLLVAGGLALAGRGALRRGAAPEAVPERAGAVTPAPLAPAPILPAAADPAPAPAREARGEAALPAAAGDDLATLRRGLVVPVEGVPRSELRDSYAEARGDRVHEAMDVLAPRGTPVLSAADGRVVRLFDSEPGGLMVYASDPSGKFILLYGHLDRYADGLADGAPLARGQVIGYVGTTGNAGATPHLHFEIQRGDAAVSWWEGVPVNPYPLFVP
jgi:murein DD-endopeptidase MepM/ murein hydrolase activator NlpD